MTTTPPTDSTDTVRVDIVSDVVCPWCIIGFRQLEQALIKTQMKAEVYWHPFELNPDMPPEGQDLRAHVSEKYGSTPAQSDTARKRLIAMGQCLGIDFQFDDDTRIYNTFRAHQLIQWAGGLGKGHQAKLALFSAYFSDGLNVNDLDVLSAAAQSIGLDPDAARAVLAAQTLAPSIREEQQFWASNGIQGVPAMIFDQQHLVTGAQGVETYGQILQELNLPKTRLQ